MPLNHANGLMSWELLPYDLALKDSYLRYMGQLVSFNECKVCGRKAGFCVLFLKLCRMKKSEGFHFVLKKQ